MNGKQAKRLRRAARVPGAPSTSYQMQTNPNRPNYRNIILKPVCDKARYRQAKKDFYARHRA